ncbi:MAG: septum formation initiator family protein [Burkholderiaceae bacterium]|jgi:cell division protein FtsB
MKIRPYLVPGTLALLLLILQGQLWFGRGSIPDVKQLRDKLATLEAENAELKRRNEQIANEVRDLQEGLEVIETYARKELGMLKNNEIFVQYAKPNEKAATNGKPASAGQ